MGDWPLSLGGQLITAAGPQASNSEGTPVYASATVNTKGAYVQLISSTPSLSTGIIITFNNMIGASTYLVDIAIGAAGYEQVIIPNLLYDACTNSYRVSATFFFPIPIPAGVRISARCQCSINSGSPFVGVSTYLLSGGFSSTSPYGLVIDYGTNISTSKGAAIDPGTTPNTKGNYTQLVASTVNQIRGILICIGGNLQSRTSMYGGYLVDIAIGAAGYEKVIVPNWNLYNCYDNGLLLPNTSPFFPIDIPAGTRIAARAAAALNLSSNSRVFDLIIYGVI